MMIGPSTVRTTTCIDLIPGTHGKLDPDQAAPGLRASLIGPYWTRDSLRLDMSSLDIAANPPIRRDETVQISQPLAFAGGNLDAYTWIIHGVMANAQTANQADSFRRPGIFAALCIAFGIGAAVGAYATKNIPNLALGLPLIALVIVLLRCEIRPNVDRR
jgi:hypothetical protein